MKYYNSGCFIAGLIGNNIPIVKHIITMLKKENVSEGYFSFIFHLLFFSIRKGVARIIRKIIPKNYLHIEHINSLEELINSYQLVNK